MCINTPREILRFFAYHLRRMIWPLKRPPWPRNADGKIYLHIGSGPLNDERFINLDVQPYRSVHYLCDGKQLGMMSSSSVDLIYASHVLEHFSHRETGSVLSDWHRILKTGGKLLISVPDFSMLLRMYEENGDIGSIKSFLMGSQSNSFDFHRNIFDGPSLRTLLEQLGFSEIELWDEKDYSEYPFEDYAHYGPTRAFSLNVKAHKTGNPRPDN